MSFNFLLADVVSRLRVASQAHRLTVNVPNTVFTQKFLYLFYQNGLIDFYTILGRNIEVHLRYNKGFCVFSSLVLISKPSKRVY